ncbi:hypothetical protein D7X55_06470 [Corallococcus sp. AB049A]|uniref:Lipoprotein n=1 Tax=Corallococcus interemptor TaxID=2316720 RepID=A0A3A8QSA2_9BACT|nr:hypothetical protein D7Y23_27265 [Corallococcus sp. AB050B]RKH71659.1 hypothetical protein D7X96_07975 [Corallococcus interemptor]RKI72893.1 hypothetical protein D7X55_06470 [Corallococcus sp. AB049A]
MSSTKLLGSKASALLTTTLAALLGACASSPGGGERAHPWQATGERVWVQTPDCAVLRESDDWMRAHLKEGVFPLASTDGDGHGVVAASAGACRSVPGLGAASFAMADGNTCMRGVDRGEWGGDFAVFESGRRTFSVDVVSPRPRRLVRASGQLLLLSGDFGTWGFSRLVHEGRGRWRLEPFIGFPGDMYAYGHDSLGRLLLAGRDGESDARCAFGRRLYRIQEDGRIERLR